MRSVTVFLCFLLSGCSILNRDVEKHPVDRLVVLPIEPGAAAGRETVAGETPLLTDSADEVVTAQVYGSLAAHPEFRFVPDLEVASVLERADLRSAGERRTRALLLARELKADGVLTGVVSRFRERVGSQYGARQPAAVSFELELIDVATGATVWTGTFEEEQQPLTSNFLKFWMFWDSGARWLAAAELSRIGVDRLVDELAPVVTP